MNFNDYKTTYHRMPEKYRKHGDMPTQVEIQDDVDVFLSDEAKSKGKIRYFAEINRRGGTWHYGLRNSMGGGSFSSAKTKDWALYRVLSKDNVREECVPSSVTINGKEYSTAQAKSLIRNQWILSRI